MPITVNGPNGLTINFPDGTDPDTIHAVMSQATGGKGAGGAAPENGPSSAEALGRGALQGLTLNTSDEMYAGARGAYDKVFGSGDYGGAYDKALGEVRAGNAAAEKAHPGMYLGGQFGGGAIPAAALTLGSAVFPGLAPAAAASDVKTAAQAATLGSKVWRGVKGGALFGAAAGAGGAESAPDATFTDAVGNRLSGAAGGAAAGGAIGGALPPVLQLGGALGRNLISNPVKALANPKALADQKLAEAFARDQGGATPNTQQLSSSLDNLAQTPGSILADAGGKNVKGLLKAANNTPNPERNAFNQDLNDRQSQQWQHVGNYLKDFLGDHDQFSGKAEQIISARDAKAGPAFNTVFNTPFTPNQKLATLVERPWFNELSKPIFKEMIDEGKITPTDGLRPHAGSMIESIRDGSDAVDLSQVRPLEVLHRVKVRLGDMIEDAQGRPDTMTSDKKFTLRHLVALKNQMLDAIDSPAYKDALKQWGDETGSANALANGFKDALKIPPREIAKKMADMADHEAELYRMGAARALQDRNMRGGATRDRTSRDWNSPDMDARMQALFKGSSSPTGNAMKMQMQLQNLGTQAETRRNIQGNSTTYSQAKEDQEAMRPVEDSISALKAGKAAITGNWAGLVSYLEGKAGALGGMTPRVAEQVMKRASMSAGNPATRAGLQKSVSDAQAQQMLSDMRRQVFARAVTRGSSVAATQRPQQQQAR